YIFFLFNSKLNEEGQPEGACVSITQCLETTSEFTVPTNAIPNVLPFRVSGDCFPSQQNSSRTLVEALYERMIQIDIFDMRDHMLFGSAFVSLAALAGLADEQTGQQTQSQGSVEQSVDIWSPFPQLASTWSQAAHSVIRASDLRNSQPFPFKHLGKLRVRIDHWRGPGICGMN
ncbi:MAG: hypothetical protein EZS28_022158, partial [Streblomastix strix]